MVYVQGTPCVPLDVAGDVTVGGYTGLFGAVVSGTAASAR